jgi:peroxiredoxin
MTDNQKILIPEDDGAADHLKNKTISDISLPNQEGNLLRLNRADTFRIILYFFPMTGRPDRPLPDNWNSIPGAKGCTIETCAFRDNYDALISLNSIPIGISTQSISDNKEMTSRLRVPYDVLSDEKLEFKNSLNLPNFLINDQVYLKRLTLIIEKNIIKKVFYPIYPIHKHIEKVVKWLQEN